MPSLRDQILTRYWEAANVIAGCPISRPQGSSHAPTHEAGAACETSELEQMDMRGVAVQELLKRQARSLMKLHDEDAVDGLQRKDSVVDEELLRTRLDDLASVSMSAFYSYRFDLLPYYWRRLYTDALILTSHYSLLQACRSGPPFHEHAIDLIVENLDRALITAGGAGKLLGKPWIEKTLALLEEFWSNEAASAEERPCKRARTDTSWGDRVFSTKEPFGRPLLPPGKECPRYEDWTLERFEDYMNEGRGDPLPVVFTDLIKDWPALSDHPWSSPDYLLSRTFGGRRLVPVEVGRSYVDEGWGQEVIQFKEFLKRYVDPSIDAANTSSSSSSSSSQPNSNNKTGYLAQHNLFQQIPPLRNDTRVPDFCWASVPNHPTDPSKNQPPLAVPQLNAWFGPARTITPLHTDGYHNLLCQVVGAKYVRLYHPQATPRLRPRGMELGVDMSNTSEVDVGVLEGWDEPVDDDGGESLMADMRESLKGVQYWECILTPGDTLLIPIGWWHYVRSLSISFSVSFWWN